MAHWPQINDRVVLVRGDGASCRTGVEDDADGLLAVGAPLEEGWDAAQDDYELQWPSPRGLRTVLARLHHRTGGAVPLWWLEPVQEPLLHQRRSYVRAPAAGATVELTWAGESREPQSGVLADLSEGGARALLATWVPAQPGEAIAVRVDAGAARLELDGEVLRATAERSGTEVVITFGRLSEAAADAVRELVFGWQRLARR